MYEYVTLSSIDTASHNARVYNLQTLPYYLWVRIPIDMNAENLQLYQVVLTTDTEVPVPLSELVYRDGRSTFLRLTSKLLNMSVGKHMYKFDFIDVLTNDVVSFYFSYIIQTDNPEKPYIYMKPSDEVTRR